MSESLLYDLTRAEFEALCRANCPHCEADSQYSVVTLRWRPDTKEWVHDFGGRNKADARLHTLCLSNGLRNSVFAKGLLDE